MYSKKEIEKLYNKIAEYRATSFSVPLLDHLTYLNDDVRVLDVSTGTGVVIFRLLEIVKPKFVVGVDLSKKELSKAAKVCKELELANVHFLKCDGENLCFKDGCFDLIICNAGLHWLPDKQKGVDELVRTCMKGGTIAVMTPDKSLDQVQFKLVASKIAEKHHLQKQISKFTHPSYDEEEMREAFSKNNVQHMKIHQVQTEKYYRDAIEYLNRWKVWGGDTIFKSLLPQKYRDLVWNEIATELNKRYKTSKGVRIVSGRLFAIVTK